MYCFSTTLIQKPLIALARDKDTVWPSIVYGIAQVGLYEAAAPIGMAGDQWPTRPPDMEGEMCRQCRRHAALALRLGAHLIVREPAFDQPLISDVYGFTSMGQLTSGSSSWPTRLWVTAP
jgi:hypothetical protein